MPARRDDGGGSAAGDGAKARIGRRREPARVRRRDRAVIGWREWVGLPGLRIAAIRAKVDTGARSSSLHATRMSTFERDGQIWVRFRFRPRVEKGVPGRWCEAPSLGTRKIRSSTGDLQRRHLIVTDLTLGAETWEIEVSLADRQEMGFEMLVGRTAVRRRFLVDPGRSYLAGSPRETQRSPAPRNNADEEE